MKAPDAPNPTKTAAAQGAADREAAVASSIVNNPNTVTPYGSQTYTQSGTEYVTDATGKQVPVPRYTMTNTLAPAQQQMLEQQNQLGIGVNDLALSQVGQLQNTLGSPVDFSGLPDWQYTSGANYDESRKRVEDAMLGRLQSQYDNDRRALDSQLASQGVSVNSEAYMKGMDELNRRMEDARVAAVLGGGQEQSRLAALEQSQLGFNNQTRGAQAQESLALRNQPINEVGALMSGGQVTLPQFQPTYRQGINPEPVANSIYASNAQDAQNASSFNQGLFGLLGAPMGMFNFQF